MDAKELLLERVASAQKMLHLIHAAIANSGDAPIGPATAMEMENNAKDAANFCRDVANIAKVLKRPYGNA